MHLDALKYFMLVVEEKSISKAAIKVHLSQSALSQMIQKLEEDLGFQLLNRSNRGVTLTNYGEVVLKYANNIINNYDKMLDGLASLDNNDSKIIITGIWSLVAYSLPCMLYKIKKKFPNYTYELIAKSDNEIIRDIKDDLVDFGFLDKEIEDEELVFHNVGIENIVLIANFNYNVPDKIKVLDLLKLELIMCTTNKKTCDHIERALVQQGKNSKDLNVIFVSDTLTAVKSSVLNGYGMAFVPYESIKYELYEKNIKIIEIEDANFDYDIFMVSKRVSQLSEPIRNTRDYLIKSGKKIFC